MTLEEAQAEFGIKIRTLRSWRAKGWIKRYRRGDRRVMVRGSEITWELYERSRVIRQDEPAGASDQAEE